MTRAPVISVELLLDAETEAAVRAEWAALAVAGLASLAAHTAPSNRPHITLLVRTELATLDAPAVTSRPAFEVRLGAPLLFGAGARRVLARSVVPSDELLALHRAVHEAAGPGDDAAHTAPGSWTPHVTLARRLRTSDIERALGVVGGELHGTARTLRRWDAATREVTILGHFD
ncbi:2'-5' RNA ligase family protein [Microbacterium sp. Marseille-Q6965]|uniref:2'-5' RNA ligase family protein n=1 Tax=Microbacterium sp. Marseille-Q6965 TaxID=2965072 RepID=UPI0021B7B6B6|nr:2'-5' RNA ligase family protein [Microbacterium sp. Marseille-Q6965]